MNTFLKNGCIVAALLGMLPVGAQEEAATTPNADIPVSMPTDFKLPPRPFLLLSAEETKAAREKIQHDAWAKKSMAAFLADVDAICAKPNLFPDGEGGWGHLYISPDTGANLQFDPDKPHDHYCPETKKSYQGQALDDAWRTASMDLTQAQLQKLAAASLLTGDKKYANAMKLIFLDLANKYAKYRLHDRSMTHFGDAAEPIAGIATCQSIEECNLLTSLAFSYDALAGSGVLTAQDKDEIDTKLWKRGIAYMYRIMALHPSGGNWWIWQACGATVLGVTFGDAKLVALGLNTPQQGVLSMLRTNYVNDDGFTGELSPGYHAYPFRALIRMAMATKRVGIDFYKLPRFQRMFDLPMKISYPNLNLPRLNDGAQISLVSDEWAANYELAYHWYHDPAYGRLLHAIYAKGMPEISDPVAAKLVTRDSPNALLYGENLPDEPVVHSESSFLTASGLSILRSPFNDWNVILKDDTGSSGHRHPDALNLLLYANGDEAFPGTGSPHYGSPYYLQWFSQTLGANTVTLNTHSQDLSPMGKAVEFGISHDGLAAAQASAADTQGKSVAGSPALLRRTVVMTPHAIIDIFRVAPKEPTGFTKPSQPNLADWALHLNGSLTVTPTGKPSDDALIPPDQLNGEINGHAVPHQGYKFIHDLQQITSTDTIHATVTQAQGGKIDLWLPPATGSDKIYQAVGVGLETSMDQGLPMLLQRRSTNATAFTAVYAPYKGDPQVQSVRFLTPAPDGRAVAAEITQKDGKDLVLSLPEPGALDAFGASLQGQVGCRSALADGGAALLLIGESWKDDTLTLTLKTSGSVIIVASDGKTRLYNASESAIEGSIQIAKPALNKSFVIPPRSEVIY